MARFELEFTGVVFGAHYNKAEGRQWWMTGIGEGEERNERAGTESDHVPVARKVKTSGKSNPFDVLENPTLRLSTLVIWYASTLFP